MISSSSVRRSDRDLDPVAIGIDIGGTKVAAGIVTRDGQVRHTSKAPTPRPPQASSVLEIVARLFVRESQAAAALGLDVRAIGVGTAGVVDPRSGVVVSATENLTGWSGTDLRAAIAARSGLPILIDNDVNAIAIAESSVGAGRSFRRCLVVSVGTGVGGALVVDGVIDRGATGTAGEIGHLPVGPLDGPRCSCGRPGHLEAYASGPAMYRRYASQVRGGAHDYRGVARSAMDGDPIATRVLTESGSILGRTLGGVANLFDPDIVILAGGVIGSGRPYLESVGRAFRGELLPGIAHVPLRVARFRSRAGVVGAGISALRGVGEMADPDASIGGDLA